MIELTAGRYNELIRKEHSFDVLMEVYKMPHDSNFDRADQLMKVCGVLSCVDMEPHTVDLAMRPCCEEEDDADCGS